MFEPVESADQKFTSVENETEISESSELNETEIADDGSTTLIPKIIHQVWFNMGNGPTVPQKYQKMNESKMKNMQPTTIDENGNQKSGWQYVLWNEEMALNLLETDYPWFVDYFNSYKNTICKVDAIRYFILHKYGGVYMDQDLLIYRSIEPLLHDGRKLVLIRGSLGMRLWKQEFGLNNYFMASIAGHPFFELVIQQLPLAHKSWFHIRGSRDSVLLVTGPAFLSRCLELYTKSKIENNGDDGIHLLPQMTFFNQSLMERVFSMDRSGEDEWFYGMHSYDATWVGKSTLAQPKVLIPVGVLICIVATIMIAIYIKKKK